MNWRRFRWVRAIALAVMALALAACGSEAVTSPTTDATAVNTGGTTIVIGTVVPDPTEDDKKIGQARLLADYLAHRLSAFGIARAEVLLTRSPVELAKLMRQGKIDVYYDSIFPSFVVNKLADSQLFLARHKKGVERYHAVMFVKSESEVGSLDDLQGKMIAFEDPGSTSTYFLPKAELLKRGYTLTEKSNPADAVGPNEIGYYFALNDEQVVADVMNGIATAGGQQESEILAYLDATGQPKGAAEILFNTTEVYRAVISVRKDLDPGLTAALKEVLLGMDSTSEGRAALDAFSKTKKFSEFTPNPAAALAPMAQLAELIEKEIVQR